MTLFDETEVLPGLKLKGIPLKPVEVSATKDPYVTKLLNEMAGLYAERNAVYKDNYLMVGRIMEAMFPAGKTLRGADDFNRWHLFELAIVKLSRYASNYNQGGHKDSIEDMIVYLAMVAALDAKALSANGTEEAKAYSQAFKMDNPLPDPARTAANYELWARDDA